MVATLVYERRRVTIERAHDLRESAEIHQRIYQAIMRRQPAAARAAMGEHLRLALEGWAAEDREASGQPVPAARRAHCAHTGFRDDTRGAHPRLGICRAHRRPGLRLLAGTGVACLRTRGGRASGVRAPAGPRPRRLDRPQQERPKDVYEDPAAGLDRRLDDLLAQMTLEEKTCQLATLYGYNRVLKDQLPTPEWKSEVWKDGIGNIDEHCNGVRGRRAASAPRRPSRHAEVINTVQRFFVEETRLGIPVDFTNEGIRGLCHWGATSFPAQIGMGCTWDAPLVREIGRVTGREGAGPRLHERLRADPRPRPRPALGPRRGDLRRGPVPGVRPRRGDGQGPAGEDVTSTPKHFAVYSVPKGGRDGEARTDPHETPREVETILLRALPRGVHGGRGARHHGVVQRLRRDPDRGEPALPHRQAPRASTDSRATSSRTATP